MKNCHKMTISGALSKISNKHFSTVVLQFFLFIIHYNQNFPQIVPESMDVSIYAPADRKRKRFHSMYDGGATTQGELSCYVHSFW